MIKLDMKTVIEIEIIKEYGVTDIMVTCTYLISKVTNLYTLIINWSRIPCIINERQSLTQFSMDYCFSSIESESCYRSSLKQL
jgi:hypothetical protein